MLSDDDYVMLRLCIFFCWGNESNFYKIISKWYVCCRDREYGFKIVDIYCIINVNVNEWKW